MVQKLKLSRAQLGKFLDDFESIKQFEKLFDVVDQASSGLTDDSQADAGTALVSANEAIGEAGLASESLALLLQAPVVEPDDPGLLIFIPNPQAIDVHNDQSDKQGGIEGEFYHLTSAEYIGTGTGVFARRVGPKFGTDTDHTTFEADGTKVAVGAAMTWNDWNLTRDYTPAAGAGVPPRNTLVGNILKDQFRVNDALQFQSAEALHDWKEGTDLSVHIHWATGGLNDATVRGVKWEIEWAWANPVEGGVGTTVFASSGPQSNEISIPAAQPDRTHRISSIYTIPGTGFTIGSQLMIRLKRIASVTNVAPAQDPFLISFGVHYQADTDGSREMTTK